MTMPERSFGRTIRYRRTKMGLSQAKLGELVGRSASTIRSWERDNAMPNDTSVVDALAAVLDLDSRLLYSKAGIQPSEAEENPTLQEALATLGPGSVPVSEKPPPPPPPVGVGVADDLSDVDDLVDEELPVDPPPGEEEEPPVSVPVTPTPPGYVAPRQDLVYTPVRARAAEPSYVEDARQRQIYRIRNLATFVLAVALVVVLVWATSNAWDAFSTWWDDFFGNLRL